MLTHSEKRSDGKTAGRGARVQPPAVRWRVRVGASQQPAGRARPCQRADVKKALGWGRSIAFIGSLLRRRSSRAPKQGARLWTKGRGTKSPGEAKRGRVWRGHSAAGRSGGSCGVQSGCAARAAAPARCAAGSARAQHAQHSTMGARPMPLSCIAGSELSAELIMLSSEGDLRRRRPSGPEPDGGKQGKGGAGMVRRWSEEL